MNPTPNTTPNNSASTTAKSSQYGVLRKPLIEKLKLLALLALIGAMIYFSKPSAPSIYVGLALVVIGTLIRIWAGGHLRRDQQLTTSGPYAYSRNPFYLGRLFLIVGFAAMSGVMNSLPVQIITVLALLIFFFVYMPRKEEREGGRLQKMFGPDYETWKSNVPQLFPRLTPYVMNPRPWSRQLFFGGDGQFTGNKEIWTTLAVGLICALIFLRMGTQ